MLKNKLKIYNKSVLGIVIILVWSSYLPNMYPTPFQRNTGTISIAKDLAEAPEFIKKEAGVEGYTQEDIEKRIINELIFSWFKWLLMILIGILSGILIIRKRPVGYILAIFCLAFFIIMPRLYYFIRYGLSPFIRMLQVSLTKKYYLIFFRIIHGDIVFFISVIILIYLILPSTVKKFKRINGTRKPAPANSMENTNYEPRTID